MKPALIRRLFLVSVLVCAEAYSQQPAGTPIWVYDVGGLITGSPALGEDGVAYVISGNAIIAVTNSASTASNKWIFISSLNTPLGAPAVAGDGTIYVAGGNLYAITPDGAQKWSYPGMGIACPAIGPDNTVYMQGSSRVFAISSEGKLKWQTAAGGGTAGFCSPAVGRDGSVFVGSPNLSTFYRLAPDGAETWAFSGIFADWPSETAAIGQDGNIYVVAGGLYAFSPDGRIIWTNLSPNSNVSCPTIAKDGTVYVATGRNFNLGYGLDVFAVSPTGVLKWELATNLFAPPPIMAGAPAIDSAGTLYVNTSHFLFAISPLGVVEWAFDAGSETWGGAPLIGPQGTVYATFGSRLYAFSGTNALADSPWPMYRQNARHTGKIEKPSLSKPQKRSDGNLDLQLFGQVDKTFTIEQSTNLNTWTSLTNFVATTFPSAIADLSATNSPTKFYRAVEQP